MTKAIRLRGPTSACSEASSNPGGARDKDKLALQPEPSLVSLSSQSAKALLVPQRVISKEIQKQQASEEPRMKQQFGKHHMGVLWGTGHEQSPTWALY